jgi:hypothetical protein
MSVDAARRSVPIPFRITMGMKVKDLPPAASLTFEGACATSAGKRPGLATSGDAARLGARATQKSGGD